MMIVHAKSAGATAVGEISCMNQYLNVSGSSVFCKAPAPTLPMNRMTFAVSSGATPVSQTSNLLSLGGKGYPFTASSSVPWATVAPTNGIAPQPLTVKVDPAGLAAGTYSGIITIAAEGTTETIVVNTVVSTGPVITSVQNAGSAGSVITGNSFVTIYGAGFSTSPVSWAPTTSLPTSLGGVSVTVNGTPCYISYAGPSQINVLTPALSLQDAAVGSVQFQVTTASGTATGTATVGWVAPAWFTYTTGGPTWVAALIPANTVMYVAPVGTFGPGASRPAKAGDYIALHANGLGATSPAAPTGAVLTTAYALDDLSRVKVTIGGYDVPVLYAGLIGAGLYQVNIQVPSGFPGTGELPVLMMVSGQPTQGGATLTFE